MSVKKTIKKFMPSFAKDGLLNTYHLGQAIAANIRYGFPARGAQVIMITGTNGKTTTSAFVARMLTEAGHKVGVNTTAFYSFGDGELVPNDRNRTVDDIFRLQKMIAKMKANHCEYIVMEVTSHALAQHRVWGIPCDVAVMTNLTQDHLDYHKTMERYAAAKGKLFARKPRLIVLNHDDAWFDFFNRYDASQKKVSYGTNSEATARITNAALHKDGSDVSVVFEGDTKLTLHTHLPGKFNVYNATAAATVGYYLQLEPQQVIDGIAALQSVPGRLERIDAGQPFEVIIDYAHTPDAFENILSTVRSITKGNVAIVFGATGDRDRTKRPIMGKIAVRLADSVYITDEESYSEDPATIRAEIMQGVRESDGLSKTKDIADRREAIKAAFANAKAGDTVLITGMGHELFRQMGDQKIDWNEAQVVRELLAEMQQ